MWWVLGQDARNIQTLDKIESPFEVIEFGNRLLQRIPLFMYKSDQVLPCEVR
jgi:hypothetical protein